MRQGIKRILELQGFEVDTAQNGSEGIELGVAQEYDLYFIDLKMPDLDGTEVLRSIKLAYPEAICIIVTAFASIDSAVTTTQMGAYRYIPKPFEPDELLHIVKTAMERRALIKETRQLQEERQRRLLELSREQSRVRTIINALDDGILIINQDEEIVLYNTSFLTLLEINKTIAVGKSIHDVLPQEICDLIREMLSNKQGFTAIKQEYVVHPPAEKVVMANTTPILGPNGELLGLVSVIRDITELKKIDIMRSQFVNMAAHELKAPLSAVQGYLELIVEKALGDDQSVYDSYLQRSLERTKALVSLINDLLNISRMEAGTTRREIRDLDVGELLKKRLSSFEHEIQKCQLNLHLNINSDLTILADHDEMMRLFGQIIGNAVKYNKPGGEINITAKRESHYVRIDVQDTGIGLTEEEKSRLFEEFFRAKNKLTRSITGTGLGLTIAKRIVDAYAGRIEVESEFEHGSTFTVYLPARETNESNEKQHEIE